MKKKSLLITIIVLLVILILAGGIFAYIYLATDILKTDKEAFAKYALKLGDQEKGFVPNILEQYESKKMTNAYENSGEITATTEVLSDSIDSNIQVMKNYVEFGNNTNISFDGKVDTTNKKVEQNISINYSDNVSFPFKYKQDGDVYGIQSDYFSPNYIAIENNNLQELFQKFGVLDTTNIPNKIEYSEIQSLKLTDEEKTHLQQNYLVPILNSFSDDKFSKIENADDSVSYVLSTTNIELKDLLVQTLETFKNDTIMLNKVNSIIEEVMQENYNEEMQLTSQDIEEMIEDLNDMDSEQKDIKISITQKDGVTNKVSIISDEVTLEISITQTDSNVIYNISLNVPDSITISMDMSYSGVDTNTVVENISFSYEVPEQLSTIYSYNNTITFGNEINIEDLGTNATVLNNYPAEQVQPFIVQITNRLVEVNNEHMSQIGFPTDMVNPMVMWFTMPTYLQIYNSASESIQNSNLNEQEKDANNMEFESYKGQIKGSQVKNLCDKVKIKGLDGTSDKINVKLGQPASSTSFVENVNDINTIKSSILSGKTYNVTLSYDTATGYVCEIGIEEIN